MGGSAQQMCTCIYGTRLIVALQMAVKGSLGYLKGQGTRGPEFYPGGVHGRENQPWRTVL